MAQFAMLFPGQGAQSVGMLSDLQTTDPVVADTWAEAGDILGYDMAGMVAEDAEGKLGQTEYTQPALLAANVAVWRAWQARGGARPDMLAGHSLGEYAALVAADVMSFADALRLTQLRGRAMQDAVKPGEGAMAAVIGLEGDAVRAVCDKVTTGDHHRVTAANFNAPVQVVIAGHVKAVEEAAERAKDKGAKLVKVLAVSVPSHCALMALAAEQLAGYLHEVTLQPPRIPVLHNVDSQSHATVGGIREALVAQLASPVYWTDTVATMRDNGCTILLECGPGKVLTGLNRRIDKSLEAIALKDADGMQAGLSAVA